MNNVNIQEIIDNGYCLGCGLCVSVIGKNRLRIVENKQGFLVPLIDNKQGITYDRRFCPGITLRQSILKKGERKIYGPFKELRAGFSSDVAIRTRASSGGVITSLLCYLLDKSIIDGVLHAGKDLSNPVRTAAYFSRTKEEVISRCGSRYAPSSLLTDLVGILENGYKIAVVGKPCDIAAVKSFLNENNKYQKQVVLTISFMCMGMPSYNGTYKLIRKLGCEVDEVGDFWYRGNGWPGKATAIDKQGNMHTCSYEESWGNILCNLVNFRCKICPDGYGEFADLSCGDAWYLKNGAPSFEETEGRSLLFVRTDQGESVYRKAAVNGYIKTEDFNIDELKFSQASQYHRKLVVGARYMALKVMGDSLLDMSGFDYFDNLRKAGLMLAVKNFTGMCKRRAVQIWQRIKGKLFYE